MAANKLPVLIIGSGIAGLSLAKMLSHHGIAVSVFEASPASRTQGYGITIREFAYGPLLKELGYTPDQLKKASATDREIGGVGKIDASLRDAYTGEALVKAPPTKNDQGQEFYRANRNALRGWLCEGVDIHFDHKLVSFEIDKQEGFVTAQFQNGKSVIGCLLVAADGMHSTVRKQRLPAIQPKILPAVVYNGELHMTRPSFDEELSSYMTDTNVIIGAGDNSNFGITITNITSAQVDLNWSFTRPVKDDSDPLYNPSESLDDQRKIRPEFLQEIDTSNICAPYSTIINSESIKTHGLFHWIMRSIRVPLEDLDMLAEERIAFVGDAVHGMPIFAGEGGNHALLDAVELGQLLSKNLQGGREPGGLTDCIRNYNAKAYPRWQKGIDESEQRLHALHRPIKVWRDIAAAKSKSS
ncbi:FAD-dependent monooxygenase [Xylogone sp. PMI_703]|nr:FAD-dependent monooxygenase [Xylogone sp. PMI_703]